MATLSARFFHRRVFTRVPGFRKQDVRTVFISRGGAFVTNTAKEMKYSVYKIINQQSNNSLWINFDNNRHRFFSTDKPSPPEGKEVTFEHRPASDDDDDDVVAKSETAEEAGVDISTFTHKIETVMPDLESDGKVEKWYKNEGDIIRRGDVICDIELEQFSFAMESDDEGMTIMGEIHVPAGEDETVSPGTPLCTILHESDPNA